MSSANMSGSGVVVQGGGWFIDSFNGNIKEQYHFIEKLASGGFGVVYLAEHRKTSKYLQEAYDYRLIEVKYAIKAIQKKRVKDYLTFQNEIKLLRVLVI
jgi:serine/threonine protein kinase